MPHGGAGVDPHLLVLLARYELLSGSREVSSHAVPVIARVKLTIFAIVVVVLAATRHDWLVLVQRPLLVESEGGHDEEAVVVVSGEDLRDGQKLLLTLLPDLQGGQDVEQEAAEEDDGKSPETGRGPTSPVV